LRGLLPSGEGLGVCLVEVRSSKLNAKRFILGDYSPLEIEDATTPKINIY
jgi:hypothetical protein